MSALAAEHGAVNLSQGFPDFDCDPALVALVDHHMRAGHNQYAPMAGLPLLREVIAAKVNRIHGSAYAADGSVTITAGGTQALFTALCCVLRPGDEVIVFEPAYDCYVPTIQVLGAAAVPIELSPPDYRIDWNQVRAKITGRTRMILINTPHNPTGTVLESEDLEALDELTANTDILVLSDEVYEHIIFDGRTHQSAARFPGLRERTFITASFGKLFHTTGWKIGYCLAPPALMAEFRKVHQFNVFSVNTPMQHAIADYLQDEASYLSIAGLYAAKRDLFRELLAATPFRLLPGKGSYFQTVSYDTISGLGDVDFCRQLAVELKVAAIPVSAFYTQGTDHKIIRFCFAKKNETLEEAVYRLRGIGEWE